jgi:hypothetical protein
MLKLNYIYNLIHRNKLSEQQIEALKAVVASLKRGVISPQATSPIFYGVSLLFYDVSLCEPKIGHYTNPTFAMQWPLRKLNVRHD